MTMQISELADPWVRFKTFVAFGGVPREHLPAGVEPDDYDEQRILVWKEIESLPDDAGPNATLLKTIAALRAGHTAHEGEGVAFSRGLLLAECLMFDALGVGDAESTGLSDEMKRAAVSTIGDVLRAAAEDFPGEGVDGCHYESAQEAWARDFGADERAAAE